MEYPSGVTFYSCDKTVPGTHHICECFDNELARLESENKCLWEAVKKAQECFTGCSVECEGDEKTFRAIVASLSKSPTANSD